MGVVKGYGWQGIKKLKDKAYLTLLSFAGRQGSVIYLKSYLSTMFQVSDVMVDKEEIAMSLNVKFSVNENDIADTVFIHSEQISVSKELSSVSKTLVGMIVQKVSEILSDQGFSCGHCPKIQYMLYPLYPDYMGSNLTALTKEKQRFAFTVACSGKKLFEFEMRLTHISNQNERGNQDD